jgi:hypothetical protein
MRQDSEWKNSDEDDYWDNEGDNDRLSRWEFGGKKIKLIDCRDSLERLPNVCTNSLTVVKRLTQTNHIQ